MIMWKQDEFIKHTFIRLDEFHTLTSYCSGIGKISKDAALKINIYLPVAVRATLQIMNCFNFVPFLFYRI